MRKLRRRLYRKDWGYKGIRAIQLLCAAAEGVVLKKGVCTEPQDRGGRKLLEILVFTAGFPYTVFSLEILRRQKHMLEVFETIEKIRGKRPGKS